MGTEPSVKIICDFKLFLFQRKWAMDLHRCTHHSPDSHSTRIGFSSRTVATDNEKFSTLSISNSKMSPGTQDCFTIPKIGLDLLEPRVCMLLTFSLDAVQKLPSLSFNRTEFPQKDVPRKPPSDRPYTDTPSIIPVVKRLIGIYFLIKCCFIGRLFPRHLHGCQ
ncbi:MAG: hypothetical protein LBD69_03325 [Puniceicoccales bacterium]|jgi:hypothetical protein|nr:hypothetical protein [Puniceicoccales bacterium]